LNPDTQFVEVLNDEIEVFRSRFPGLSIRFCRIMGRRLSHITGDSSGLDSSELRLEVTENLVMMVSGAWEGKEDTLRRYASELGMILEED